MDVVVRRGVAQDAPALARLRWRWRHEETGEPAGTDRESFVEFLTGWILDHAPTHVPFVAQIDGRLAGMAWLSLTDRIPTPWSLHRRAGDIQSVYVIPEARGHGIGAGLITAVVAHARDLELEYLIVHSAIDSVGFYHRLGFIDEGRWFEYPRQRLAPRS